jgi:hypothetical protein
MWSQTRDGRSSTWTDEFEYTAVSCDGEKVKGKVAVDVKTSGTIVPVVTTTTTTLKHAISQEKSVVLLY